MLDRADIPGNRWDLLVPDADSTWSPSKRVSVCMPVRDPDHRLLRTIASLASQTYPSDLVELVVVDDSSQTPIDLGSIDSPFPITVVRQDADGFAAGRARHLAATHAEGDVLVFLDADVIPGRHVLASYLRWFDRSSWAMPFGFCRFVDLSAMSDGDVTQAIENDVDLADGREVDSQAWREWTLSRTRDLTVDAPDLFRVVVGASLALSADRYHAAGGFRDLGVRGIEDIEFGYRMQNHGALLIPDRDAVHWHQGRRSMSGDRVAEIELRRRPFAERLLPVGGFRSDAPGPGPVEVVPQIELVVPDDTPEARADDLRRGLDSNTSVRSSSEPADGSAFASVEIDAEVDWTDEITSAVVTEFGRTGAGTVLVATADRPELLEVVRTRARVSTVGADRATRRRRFGVAVISWSEALVVQPDGPGLGDVARRARTGALRWRKRLTPASLRSATP